MSLAALIALVVAAVAIALLLATWVVYPLVMIAVARLRGRPPVMRHSWRPRVTVLLATREPAEAITARVNNLLASAYPSDLLEVVVGLEPGLPNEAELLAAVSSLPRTRAAVGDAPGGKAANLNAAERAATGQLLVFADSYQRFGANTISQLVAALGDPRFGAVSGSLHLPGESEGHPSLVDRYWRLERRLREAEGAVSSSVGVTGAVYAMHRDAWAPLPAGLILDDLYVPMRVVLAGRRVGFLPGAVAREVRTVGASREYGRKVRTLTGNLQLCAWLPAVLSPLRNPIWLQFICHKLMRLATPYLLLVAMLAAAIALLVAVPRWIPPILGAGAALALIVAWAPIAPLRRVRETVRWGFTMQAAVVTATVRGLRGQWDVWQ